MLRRSSIAACALLIASIAASGACSSPEPAAAPPSMPQPQSSRSAAPPRDEPFIVAPDLPPLSSLAVAETRQSPEIVRAVHLFAARHPEVLSYMPCFCGCQRSGHKHNDDCFVAGRDGTGKVTAWDYHGVG
jgi:Protein of unknown function with PCYCGC motif